MKRGLSIITMAAAFALLTSMQCGRDYTCQCQGGITGNPDPITVQARNVKYAQQECDKYNNAPGTPDGFYDCKIK